MEFITGLFAGIAFWPILIIALEIIILGLCVENERGVLALFSIIGTAILLWLLTEINVFRFVYEHPFQVLLYGLGYVACGVAYALWRWDWQVARWRDEYDEAPENKQKSMLRDKPRAIKNKERIMTWMGFWVWSLFWWIFSDLLVEMWNRIYKFFGKWFDAITERRLKDLPEADAE